MQSVKNNINAGIIIQARMGSSRLYGKVMKDICGFPMIYHIIKRLSYVKNIKYIIVATTYKKEDDVIYEYCIKNNIHCYRGSSKNVLERFYKCASKYHLDIITRITGDCPLICPHLVESNIALYINSDYDCISPRSADGLIRGLDNETFSFDVLNSVYKANLTDEEKEHVTLYIYNNADKYAVFSPPINDIYKTDVRLCVDEIKDLELMEYVYKKLYKNNELIEISDVVALLKKDNMTDYNKSVKQLVF